MCIRDSLGRAARNAGNVKNRQPLSEMYVVTARELGLDEGLKAIALDELNIKKFRTAADADEFISYKLKPQLKTLGPKYGKMCIRDRFRNRKKYN